MKCELLINNIYYRQLRFSINFLINCDPLWENVHQGVMTRYIKCTTNLLTYAYLISKQMLKAESLADILS